MRALVVDDIDPSFTLGSLDRERREVLARLERDGATEWNKAVPLADVPKHVLAAAVRQGPFVDQAAIGLAYTGLDKWEFEFDVSWAGWSPPCSAASSR